MQSEWERKGGGGVDMIKTVYIFIRLLKKNSKI